MSKIHIVELLVEANKKTSNIINKIENEDTDNNNDIISAVNDVIRQLDKIVEQLEKK